MHTDHWLFSLKETLPPSSCPWVISALKQDRVLWESLQEAEFAQQALEHCGNQPSNWSPAFLALLAMEQSSLIPDLHAFPVSPLESGLRQKAARAYEALTKRKPFDLIVTKEAEPRVEIDTNFEPSLTQSGLVALALRERFRVVGSWTSLTHELRANNDVPLQAWQTPMACLFGMLPDPVGLLRALLFTNAPSEVHALVVHALLSNPLSPEEQLKILQATLARKSADSDLHPSDRLALLRQAAVNRQYLARQLAEWLLTLTTPSGKVAANDLRTGLLDKINGINYRAELHYHAGNYSQSMQMYEEARSTAQMLQANLIAEWASIATQATDEGPSDSVLTRYDLADIWEKAVEMVPCSPGKESQADYQHYLSLALLEAGDPEEMHEWLSRVDEIVENAENQVYALRPEILLALSRRFHEEGNLDRARQIARMALETYKAYRQADESITRSSVSWKITHQTFSSPILEYLFELNLVPECVQAARLALEDKPASLEAHLLMGKALFHLRQFKEATRTFQLAALLAPEVVDIHRLLAGGLEAIEDWEAALQERKTILLLSPPIERTQVGDLHALANSAIHVGQYQQAVESCQQALTFGEDDWQATILLGKALLQLGNPQSSLEYLTRAVHLAPNQARPWLEISAALQQTGQTQKAVDTLRAGIQAVPQSAEIHLGLGEALLSDGLPTQALPALQRAYEIAGNENQVQDTPGATPSFSLIALRLGQTLLQLGHLGESRKVLEKAYQDNIATGMEDQPDLSYAYAQTLVALKDHTDAIPILADYLKTGPEEPDPYLDYASSLLAVGETPEIAVQVLQHVSNQYPSHLEAKAMLAEALFAAGDHSAAVKIFLTLLESELVKEKGWQARLSFGLGRAALALGQVDTAAVAFQEAVHIFPDNPLYYRALAEAYWSANLYNDGWNAARTTLQLDGTNLDNLMWFAERAIQAHQDANQTVENLNEKSTSGRDSQVKASPMNSQQLLSEALDAFSRVQQLTNQRGDLLVQIGRLQLLSGDPCAAHESFRQSISIEEPAPENLHHAARYLLEIGDVSGAITALEEASESLAQHGAAVPLDLIIDHARAYRAAKELPAARIKLEKAIQLAPSDASLYQDLSEVLLLTGQVDQAVACLNQALNNIQDPTAARSIHFRAALANRQKGNLVPALNHAEQALPTLSEPENSFDRQYGYAALSLAGVLARALLQPERARRDLKSPCLPPNPEEVQGLDPSGALEYYCLNTELALEAGEEDEAESSLGWAIKITPQHPRTLANLARVLNRQGKMTQAQESLKESVGRITSTITEQETNSSEVPPDCDLPAPGLKPANPWTAADYLSVAEAASDLKEWETALSQAQQAIKRAPQEPYTQLCLARILALRAEYGLLCQDLEIITHGPGGEALDPESRDTCFTAIQTAEQDLQNAWLNRQENPETRTGPSQVLKNSMAVYPPLLARWICRSQAIFSPLELRLTKKETENIVESVSWSEFTLTPDDIAARIAFFRHWSGLQPGKRADIEPALQSALNSAQTYPKHPQVMVQVALALEENQIQEAIIVAHALTNILANLPDHPLAAPSHALLSRLSQRIGDHKTAFQEIEQALHLWPDEPRWHALAATISRLVQGEQGKASANGLGLAISHLEEAVKLDPRNLRYYLDLGNTYLEASRQDTMFTKKAIRYLERASRIAPMELNIWRALSEAYLQAGGQENLDHAADCTEKAILLSYQTSGAKVDTWPHLLRARIALKMSDPQEAYRRASEAADLDPMEAEAVLVQSEALETMDHLEEALTILEKALPFVKDPLKLKLKQANLLRHFQGTDAALKVLSELAETNPHDPAVLATMARTLADAGDPEAAIQAAQIAMQATTMPENSLTIGAAEKAELHYLLGSLLDQVGQLDQAIHHLNQAVQLQPGFVEPYLELGFTYQKQRQYLKAQKAFEEAMKNAPDDYRPYFQVGLALKDGKDYQGAERMLRRATELAPNDVNIKRQLAAVVAINLIHNPQATETQPAR